MMYGTTPLPNPLVLAEGDTASLSLVVVLVFPEVVDTAGVTGVGQGNEVQPRVVHSTVHHQRVHS